MMRSLALTAAMLGISFATARAADAPAGPSPFDGRWTVTLVCPDTQDRRGLVKGYEWTFPITIAAGKVDGQHGTPGEPASVRYTGDVASDGTLELRALGNTGAVDYSVGQVARGSNYGYTLSGHLDQNRGQAVRREIRPCTASFARTAS